MYAITPIVININITPINDIVKEVVLNNFNLERFILNL
jgi:hypothetical protein